MNLLKENKFQSDQLLNMWANKDLKVIKTKKVKKDFSWSNYESSSKTTPQKGTSSLNTNQGAENQNNTTQNNNNNIVNKKPPLPEPVKLKFPFDGQKSQTKKDSSNTLKLSTNKTDQTESTDQNLGPEDKNAEHKNLDESSTDSRSTSETNSNSNSAQVSNQGPSVLNRYLHKKAFYPNQTSKIYPVTSNSFTSVTSSSGDYYDPINFSKQISISPVKDLPKIDLSDIRRPFSSSIKQNGEAYIKKDTYPKFAQRQPSLFFQTSDSKSTDENMSIDSDLNIFKQGPDGEESNKEKENESKI